MADRPIRFIAPMIRAMLEGRKFQTRRILKASNTTVDGSPSSQMWDSIDIEKATVRNQSTLLVFFMGDDAPPDIHLRAPHRNGETFHRVRPVIKIGDRLWVREAWRTESRAYDDLAPSEMGGEETILYEADADWSLNKSTGRLRASMHMPRWASRMTLIVTGVKIERLQDISEVDAIAEGVRVLPLQDANDPSAWWEVEPGEHQGRTPQESYRKLWDHINGYGAWNANPWVTATTYDVIKANIDEVSV